MLFRSDMDSNGSAEARVLSTFLNEMDGVDIEGAGKDGVLVLGATNRPWTLDSALLRPGRLGDNIIFLPPPDNEARLSILKMQFGKIPVGKAWDWGRLIELSEGMTGAEIVGACQEAKLHWIRDNLLSDPTRMTEAMFKQDYIFNAIMSVKPLLSDPSALEEFRIFEKRDNKSFH